MNEYKTRVSDKTNLYEAPHSPDPMLEGNNLRIIRVLSHELLPDGLLVGIVLTAQLLRGNLPRAAHLLPEDSPGVAEVGDEQGPVVHDADEAARPGRGDVRLGLPEARHEGEEAFLRSEEGLPDGFRGHAVRAGGRLCAQIKHRLQSHAIRSRLEATKMGCIRVWITSEVGEEVVACEAGGVGAAVAVEDAEDGAEGRGGLEAALVLEHLVGLGDGDGDLAGVAAREVAPPEEAVAALRVLPRGGGGAGGR
ncbi:unnamed protein product [Urochloa decumbens]|uniref:Uncharacterized protein n=1 Tax=Urochloa decumbens TaxID=240449 RepID=A0ABC8X496_9POAL